MVDILRPDCRICPKEVPAGEEIVSQCFAWHEEFDQKYWQGKPSFHNKQHLQTTITAAELLIQAVSRGEDPLGMAADSQIWNEQHPQEQIKQEELPEIVRLALACHDLGNIMESVSVGQNRETRPVFLPAYRAGNAENRSIAIADEIIKSSRMPEDRQRRYLPLIRHLIDQTKFNVSPEAPLGVFIKVVDQIGNDILNQDNNRVIGLLEEMMSEDPDRAFSPFFFFNFSSVVFSDLVASKETREKIISIWGKNLPENQNDLPQNEVRIQAWLQEREKVA